MAPVPMQLRIRLQKKERSVRETTNGTKATSHWRKRLKKDEAKFKRYLKSEATIARLRRLDWTEERRQREKVASRDRMRKYRLKNKQEGPFTTTIDVGGNAKKYNRSKPKIEKEEQRCKWVLQKKKERGQMSEEKRKKTNENRRKKRRKEREKLEEYGRQKDTCKKTEIGKKTSRTAG